MMDKRRQKRSHLIYYLRIFDKNSGELLGHLVDITPEGIMLLSEKAIDPDKVYQLKMVLPTEIMRQKELNFEGRSLWCKRDVNSDFFDTGFKLTDVPPEGMGVIKNLVEEFGFQG